MGRGRGSRFAGAARPAVRQRALGGALAAALLALMALGLSSGGASAEPIPVVVTEVCANNANGALFVPQEGGVCAPSQTLYAVDDPSEIHETCYLNSNGAIRKVTSATQCASAPRSKKETPLLVPSLTDDLYFCANTSDGSMFFRGTNPVNCKKGQFLVVIENANNPPVAAAATLTTLEDTPGATTLSATDEDGDALTFALATQGTKGTAALTGSVSCDGLTPSTCTRGASYTPNADANGSDSFTYTASDPYATSVPATVSVTITPVNDAPSFTKGADQTVAEDAGAQTVSGWASAISAGPANESSQTVSFNVTGNTNSALFSAGPAVSSNGTLTYTPAADANGSATITLVAQDNGGTANGGVDTSPPQSFAITVTAVNDAPSFTKGADETVLEDAGAQSVAGWATAISPGPADEAGQTVSFTVTGNTNPSLFAAAPAVSSNGTLSYTPAADANGSATITLKAVDDGAPPAESAEQTFTITVTPVNDAPSFDTLAGDPPTVNEDVMAQTVTGFASGMSAGPANESAQVLTFVVVSNTNPSLFTFVGQPLVDATTGTLTYALAPDANGTATITIKLMDDGGTANGGDDDSDTQQFTITVNAVNDAPSFALPAEPDQTALEDAGAQSVAGFASAISKGPADESGQTLTFHVAAADTSLFSVQPDIDETTGNLTYTSAANANGSTTVTVTLSDDGGTANGGVDTSAPQQFDLTITAVNDEPSFELPASPNQTVDQDPGPQTVQGFATNISAGPSDEAGQALTFHVSNDNSALFSAQPGIDEASGDLTYTPAAGATGSATVSVFLTDDGGTANGGDDTSPTQTFTITVKPPNEAPVAIDQTGGAAVAATEDGGTVTITLTATDADDDDLTFEIVGSPTKGTLGTEGPPDCTAANTCTATVDYTPSANENGLDSFSFKANDGQADSNVATVEVSIAAVNDAPSFTKGADQTVLEDAGAQTVNGWATSISAGPANESGQSVTFEVTGNTNTGLFSAAPAVSPSGDLTYTAAADAFGAATITLVAKDDGGTANGGVDTSAPQTFTITVTPVNDAPSFTKGADQTVNEDAGAQTVVGWATAITAGPANESSQTLTFVVTNNTNPGLFSAGPAVSPTGTLTYTTAANKHGSATITLRLTDNGGTANGGVDESGEQSFTITVNAVNDPPTSPGRAFGVSSLQANMQRSIAAADGLLVGAADAADVAGNPSWTPTFTVGTVNGVAPVSGTITVTIAGVGTVVADASTGAFTIDPAPGVTGNVSFNFTVCDNGEGTPASACSAAANASFNIAGPVIWFVNPAAVTNGDGRLSSPFNVLSGADAVDATDHRVFVYSGSTTTGLALNSGEWLIGQGAMNSPTNTFDALMGISPPADTVARPTIGGTRPTIGGTVALNTNARVQGLNITTSGAAALTDTGGHSGVAVSEAALSATNGAAADLNATGGSIALSSLSSSASPTSGIALTNVTASFSAAAGSITSATNADVAISGGNGAFDYDGSITDDLGALVTVANTTGGVKSFDGAITDLNNGTGNGISLTTNTGTTINFTGGLTLSTGSNAAFNATGPGPAATSGGTVNVTGTNTIATTTGTALNVANTTIGASGLTFTSISASGGANGIVLNNTGSSGGLTVTGDGSNTVVGGNSSGGTIANMSGADGTTAGTGVYLNNTSSVVLRRMTINGTNQNYGIRGTLVNGFTLEYSTVSGTNGTASTLPSPENYGEGAIHFGNATTNGVVGTVTLTNNSISGGRARDFSLVNTSPGTTNLTVKGNTFGGMQNFTDGNQCVAVEARVSSGVVINTTFGGTNAGEGNTVNNCVSDNVNFTGQNNTTMDVVFRNNTLSNNHPGNIIGGGNLVLATKGTMTFHVTGNTMRDANGSAVTLFKASADSGTPSMNGYFANNTIGVAGVTDSGSKTGNGIFVSAGGTGTMSYTIANNAIHQIHGNAHIYADNTGGSYTANFTITGNTLDGAQPPNWFAGIAITNGSPTSSDTVNVCAKIGGSTAAEKNTLNLAANLGVIVGASGAAAGHAFNLPGYAGGANLTNVQNFISANNTGSFTTNAYADAPATAGAFIGTGPPGDSTSCPTPSS